MKRLLLLLSYMGCLMHHASGQDSTQRSVYIGVDVLKSVWPLVGVDPGVQTAYTLEPSLIVSLRKPARYLHITPGITSFSGQTTAVSNVIEQSGHGYYLKVSHERRKYHELRKFYSGVGLGLFVSNWQDGGSFRFRGSYFGNYIGTIQPLNRVAVGSEFFLSQFIPIAQRVALRFQLRVNLLLPYPAHDERPNPAYLPGVGLVTSGAWQFGGGFTLQFFYRVVPKRTL